MRDETVKMSLEPAGPATDRPISIAIVAMGGQGGGVLTDWIVSLAESKGWVAQSTSVPGVAQRTGATIYYVEMMPMRDGQRPILAQMPTPGDVDVVMASEFIEAGRAVLRGIVTPDKTTLIASSHRSLAVTEKMAPGEGIADSGIVRKALGVTAKREIVFDMDALAVKNGSVISSSMFGALAAANVLPFAPEDYTAIIRHDGKGVEASLRTFQAAYDTVLRPPAAEPPQTDAPALAAGGDEPPVDPRFAPLLGELRAALPERVHAMATAGLRKVVDYQDIAYGREYLSLLTGILAKDKAAGGEAHRYAFTLAAAKHLANAMTYDDVIRVADLKTRPQRRARIAREMGVKGDQVLQTTEFMHPRIEEVNGLLPAPVGAWLESKPGLYGWLGRRISKGRRVKTYSLGWFLVLYSLAGLRRIRHLSLRHHREVAHRDAWLAEATRLLGVNYALAVEVVEFRRLIKGYSDTHDRAQSKFHKVLDAVKLVEHRSDAADWAKRLREAAVRDASEGQIDGVVATMKTFL